MCEGKPAAWLCRAGSEDCQAGPTLTPHIPHPKTLRPSAHFALRTEAQPSEVQESLEVFRITRPLADTQ